MVAISLYYASFDINYNWIRIQRPIKLEIRSDPDPRTFVNLPEDDGVENCDQGEGDEATDGDQVHWDPHVVHYLH